MIYEIEMFIFFYSLKGKWERCCMTKIKRKITDRRDGMRERQWNE
jgi:hypothetical protein